MESIKEFRGAHRTSRRIVTVLAALGVALGQTGPAAAESGALEQLPQPAGCILEDGDGMHCTDGAGLNGASGVAVSPDQKSVYVASLYGDTLAVFARHKSTGALTQLPEPEGCFGESGDGITCTAASGLAGATAVTVSPDGKYVYAGGVGGGIAVFARDRATGALTQLPGTDGCLLTFGGGATGCADVVGPIGASTLVVSRDGKHLYAAALNGDAIGVFARDRVTGVLTQLPAPDGCLAENGDGISCIDAVGLDGPDGLALSRNGKQVYVASSAGDTVAVFERDRTTGALTQFPAPAGCLAETGDGVTCTDAIGLDGAADIALSKTARQVYVVGRNGHTIAIFARNAATGVLTQLPAPDGCVSANGDGITCTDATAMTLPTAIALTNDGKHAYVTSTNNDAVAVFARDKKTGTLTQLPAPHGCVSATGDGVTCTYASGLENPHALAIPKSAKHVYVTSYSGSSIAVFAREK